MRDVSVISAAVPTPAGAQTGEAITSGVQYVAVSTFNRLDRLPWLVRTGRLVEPIGDPRTAITGPTVSPDGRRVAFSAQDNDNVDIWVQDLARGGAMRNLQPRSGGRTGLAARGELLAYVRVAKVNAIQSRIRASNFDECTVERDPHGKKDTLAGAGRAAPRLRQAAVGQRHARGDAHPGRAGSRVHERGVRAGRGLSPRVPRWPRPLARVNGRGWRSALVPRPR